MRKKQHISQLENQVAELMATVNSLLEVVTKPTPKETKTLTNTDLFVIKDSDQRRHLQVADKAGMAWTDEERTLLIQLRGKGLNNRAIGKIIGRSDMAVSNQTSKIRNSR